MEDREHTGGGVSRGDVCGGVQGEDCFCHGAGAAGVIDDEGVGWEREVLGDVLGDGADGAAHAEVVG